jgi:hypothetical protein
MSFRQIYALLWLHGRFLRQNPSACVILCSLAVSGVFLAQQDKGRVENTCYVLYWQRDAWVEYLQAAMPAECSMHIEVADANSFTNEQGLVVYPVGAHSIQIRQAEDQYSDATIWYWYNGRDPEVMQPAVNWFWRKTAEFQNRPVTNVRVSSLQPVSPVMNTARLSLRQLSSPEYSKPLLLVGACFFCCAYLPAMFVAEMKAGRHFELLSATPAGIKRCSQVSRLFFMGLSCAVVTPSLVAFGWYTSTAVYLQLLLLSVAYVGVGFALGSVSRNVSSAVSSTVVYMGASIAMLGLLHLLSPRIAIGVSLEASFVSASSKLSLDEHLPNLATLMFWATLWTTLGSKSLLRCRR